MINCCVCIHYIQGDESPAKGECTLILPPYLNKVDGGSEVHELDGCDLGENKYD